MKTRRDAPGAPLVTGGAFGATATAVAFGAGGVLGDALAGNEAAPTPDVPRKTGLILGPGLVNAAEKVHAKSLQVQVRNFEV